MSRGPVVQIDFGDGREPIQPFVRYDNVREDRGSRYSVCVGKVTNRLELKTFLASVKQDPRYAAATHNSWAARVSRAGAIYETKQDDGEVGAGQVILRVLQKHNIKNGVVCVTRWFGGEKLYTDRFVHLKEVAEFGVEHVCG